MPNINIEVNDEQFSILNQNRGEKTWKEFFLDTPRSYKKNQIIAQGGKKFIVKGVSDLELQNPTDDPMKVPIGPRTIIVYTIYTLEKVE